MIIRRARAFGMCFGVRDALSLAEQSFLTDKSRGLTVLGEIVHNPLAIQKLAVHGILTGSLGQTNCETAQVMITAHGASHAVRNLWKQRGYVLIDGTCPLVKKAHRTLSALVERGYHPVVIGQRNHVEVLGLTGDFKDATVVESEADFALLPHDKFLGVIAQTTQPLWRIEELLSGLRLARLSQGVEFCDTVCQPTKDRQSALEELCGQVEMIVVVGGRNSNNTRQLSSRAKALGCQTIHIEDARQLQGCWFADVESVGVTAGTSTLDETVQEVLEELQKIARAKKFGLLTGVAR